MQIFHVLTPLISREIPDLLRFIRYCPTPLDTTFQNKITWHLSIDGRWTDSQARLITQHVLNSAYSGVRLNFISCELSSEESVYLRNFKGKCELPDGSKSGPNMQIFRSLKAIIGDSNLSKDDALILLETDAIPLKCNWVSEINFELTKIQPSFWIAGAKYKGKSFLSSKFNQHFNGNAIYGVGAPGFIEFLNSWEHVLKMCIPNANWLAYDIAIEWARSSLFELESGLSNDQILFIESLLQITEGMLVDISNLIRNVSGLYETSNDFVDFDAISDSVIICHSRPLSKIISWVFKNDSLNRELLHFQSPLSRRVEALKAGIPQYLNFHDSQTFSSSIVNYIVQKQLYTKLHSQKQLYRACLVSV